ncbi:MAG: hemerythrin family protein [Myxococcales bacterium]|nr:hemerythrin family protein [Myxococcales bacterium]
MAVLEWNDRLSIGVKEFDREHQELVKMLNQLSEAMMNGQGNAALAPILDALIAYTATHFTNEEAAMVKTSYPYYAAHKEEHDALKMQVLEVQAKMRGGAQTTLTIDVLRFLRDWLAKHIQGSDKKLGAYLIDLARRRASV